MGKLFKADLSTLTVSPSVTRFHCLSHSLTVGSSFLMVFQILSGFSLKLSFLRKQTRQHNPLSKNYHSIVRLSSTYKKINNFIIFELKTSTRSSLGNGCPVNYQKVFEKHASCINMASLGPFPLNLGSPLISKLQIPP